MAFALSAIPARLIDERHPDGLRLQLRLHQRILAGWRPQLPLSAPRPCPTPATRAHVAHGHCKCSSEMKTKTGGCDVETGKQNRFSRRDGSGNCRTISNLGSYPIDCRTMMDHKNLGDDERSRFALFPGVLLDSRASAGVMNEKRY